MRRIVVALLLLVVFVWPASASAGTWSATGDVATSGTLVKGSGAWLELPWTIIWQYATNEPRSVERLPNGNTLVARGRMQVVEEVSPDGTIVWSYRTDGDLWHATRLPGGNTLIVMRRDQVIEVTPVGDIVWRYDDPTDPYSATRLVNGNTLICDNKGNNVLEVRTEDYRPGEVNDGFTEGSVVWSYPGDTLFEPKTAQRLPNGNTLIAASAYVVEIDAGGQTVWQPGDGILRAPVSAYRLDDGTTLIAEERDLNSARGRVVRLSAAGEVIWEFSSLSLLGLDDAGLSVPRRAVPGTDGSILIVDEGNDRIIELGYALSGTAESGQIDCGLPGARKQFTSMSAEFDLPENTSATVEYSVDSGPWQTAAGGALPGGTYGTLIRYRITMATTRRDITPRFLGISIGYEPAPESTGSTGTGTGTGSGSSDRSGRSNRPSSGSARGMGTGTMSSGSGYTSEGVSGTTAITTGALSLQRGWAMDSVSIAVGPSVGGRGSGGSPAPDTGGLLALGVVYAVGIASAAFQRLVALFVNRTA